MVFGSPLPVHVDNADQNTTYTWQLSHKIPFNLENKSIAFRMILVSLQDTSGTEEM